MLLSFFVPVPRWSVVQRAQRRYIQGASVRVGGVSRFYPPAFFQPLHPIPLPGGAFPLLSDSRIARERTSAAVAFQGLAAFRSNSESFRRVAKLATFTARNDTRKEGCYEENRKK